MQRARSIVKAESGPAGEATDRIVLDFDQRNRRRIALTTRIRAIDLA